MSLKARSDIPHIIRELTNHFKVQKYLHLSGFHVPDAVSSQVEFPWTHHPTKPTQLLQNKQDARGKKMSERKRKREITGTQLREGPPTPPGNNPLILGPQKRD